MSDLRDLYQEVILDHGKRPRNFGPLESATHHAEGFNPICGDEIHIHAEVDGDTVRGVRFDGQGCAISTASASLLTEMAAGKTRAEIEELFQRFHDLVTAEPDGDAPAEGLGKLAVMGGVREFPMRVKCATLAWHTLRAALDGSGDAVSTE